MASHIPQRKRVGFIRGFLGLSGDYWCSEEKWSVRLLTAALVALTVGQVVVPILINLWSKQLFDALEQRSTERFMTMVALVFAIIAFNIVNATLHLRVKRRLQLGWRRWLTHKIINDWMTRGRHYQLTYLPGEHDNPDGRIAEDIRITTESAIDLGLSLSYCVMLLISFVNILWLLSGAPEVTVAGNTFTVPGYLLYVALLYAATGTSIALMLSQPLVSAANSRQGYEADFRIGLARGRENAHAIALMHGEANERHRLFDLFGGVKRSWNGQTHALSNMMIFAASYSVLSAAFPILVAAPRYISGAISLGMLMQTAQAFQQTAAALSWPIDNLVGVAGWKASVERVLGLHAALQHLDREVGGEGQERIVVERSDTERSLSISGLSITEPDGRPVIAKFDAEILPGERVLIAGDPGAAIRLFKAVARVWPWGGGRITLPAHTRVFFVPQRPYLPRRPLRDALSYPAPPETVSDFQAKEALERVGLGYLLPRLDETEAWKESLAVAEQQRLGFARLLIRRPDWIFIEDATDALDHEGEQQMLRLLDEEFAAATVLTIDSHAGVGTGSGRMLVLDRINGAVQVREAGAIAPAGILPGGQRAG
jgi:vitamin B12/bleomycin/antimicrobial peptide transport system ATP-binding/permease protein